MKNLILYVASVLIWGSTWYAIKFQLGSVHPTLSVAYRFTLAALVLYAFCVLTKRHHQKFTIAEHSFIAAQGFLLFCFNYWLTYQSTAYLTSGLVALCFSTMTIMNIIGQTVFFKIPFDPRVTWGALLGLLGVGMVFYPEIGALNLSDGAFLGFILCLGGTLSAALGNMVSFRNTRANLPVILGTTYAMGYGAAFTYIIAIMLGAPFVFEFTVPYISSLVFLALFGSAIAFTCYLTLMANIGAAKAGYIAVLVPVVALAISTLFEGYQWTIWAICGSAFIITGNIISMTKATPFADLIRPKGWSLFKQNPPQNSGR